nr:putative ribonuclease H-like domain-containing protein [Tanacetum cinerariifolium]
MQKKKNDVNARTTLLLSLLDEYQLRFSKYKTAQELWAAILKTFGGNEATKKMKKNLLKQQYGNFKAEGSKNLEQTFNRLQVIIVWRNKSDLDTMSIDDLYNHLKVYESEVQKKTKPNSQNMAFISLARHSSENEDGNTAYISTASTNVPTASASVPTISQDTACAYIASQSSGSQIKFEDINQIDEDDMEEMDIKWNMALLSIRADKAPKNRTEEGEATTDREDHALVANEVAPTKFALMANISAESKVFDNSLCSKDSLALAQVESRLVEYKEREVKYCEKIRTLEFHNESHNKCIEILKKKLETLKEKKEGVDGRLAGLLKSSKDLDNLIESQSQSKSKSGKSESPKKPPIKYAKQYRKPNKKPNVRGNQRNWNNLKTHQLGPDFVMKKKVCFNCGDFNHLAYDCRKRAHSYANKPFHRTSVVRSPHRAPWVPTVNRNFPPVNRKFSPVPKTILMTKVIGTVAALGVRPIGIKWILKNKKDERGIVIRNKARLVAQGHTQEEGIDYDEVFAPVTRIEAIRLFLAYASFMGFTVYQMDVKSAFLYDTIDEEVYVMQPPGFQDPEYLAKVYKVEKAMYGLHQAPRAWYGTLSKYLLKNGFQRGTSKNWGILRILMISLRLIPLSEHNADFHPMVDFIEASPLRRNLKLQDEEGISSLPDTELFENLALMGSNISPNQKRTRIAQFSVLLTVSDEPASPLRDVSQGQGEAFPTDSGFIADQDRATIDKSSTLPHDSAPLVTFPVADKGSMQQTIPELMALCTSLQRQLSELTAKFHAQEVEINRLKERVKMLEDREGVAATRSGDDAPIKKRSMDEGEAATERISDDLEEMVTVLTSMDAATVLASRVVDVSTGSGSIPTASTPAEDQVPNGSDVVPTACPVFATAIVVTPYRRRKGKEVMVESETLKKQKVQEQIDAQSQQRKPMTKKKKRDYYMAVIRNNLGWKVKDFRGMTFEEVEAKFNLVWKQMEDFIPMGSKEKAKRIKSKGLNLEQEIAKKQKTSEEVYTEGQRSYWKITRLGGSSASYQFFIDLLKHLDREDLNQLWRLSASCNIQGQRNLYASGEGLPFKEGSSTCDDQLQALSRELLTDGK